MKSILSRYILKFRLILLFVLALFCSFSNADIALDRQKQALEIIADFADRFCKNIPLEGSGDNFELSGQAQAELSGVVKKLAKLGVEGAGKYQNDDYQGFLRQDLIKGLDKSVDCRIKIWGDLKNTLLTTTPNPEKSTTSNSTTIAQPPTNPDENSGKYTTNSCGSIIDTTTSLEWFVGPDVNMTWYEALEWTRNLSSCHSNWRMPTVSEIATLYDSKETAGTGYFAVGAAFPNGRHFPAKIHPVFNGIGAGSWVWTSASPSNGKVKAYNLNQNTPTDIEASNIKYSIRVFAVSRLP